MKTDFLKGRVFLLTAFVSLVSGCGQQVTPNSVFEQASDECEGEVVPGQFVARHADGRIEVVKGVSKEEFLEGYVRKNLSDIVYAEHDFVVRANRGELRQMAPGASASADNWGVRNIGIDGVWQSGNYGQNSVVAVIDTGMDLLHDQLKKQIAVNTGETGADAFGRSRADNGIDDDGNGFIDDAFGYDFTVNEPLAGDNTYHGTHVSGIIAAEHNDTVAQSTDHVQGVAPKAKLIPLAFLDSDGAGTMSDGVRAINYAVMRGAHVINASWGGPICSRSLRDTIVGLSSRNVIFVAAAGNSGLNIDRFPEYPAALNLASQFTVGAIGSFNDMANYSNYGAAGVHLFAPGSSIVSTLPGGTMGALSGTSMATPFVTGAIALMLSAVPNSTAAQVRQALYASVTKRNDYLNASKGRLNLTSAISELHRVTGR